MVWLRAFIAGFFSTLIFHQGMLALLHFGKLVARAPFAMIPMPPFGVPSVISLALWGGVWGVLLWPMICRQSGGMRWLLAIMLGALLPSLIALLVVFPLKGMAFAGNWDPKIWVGAALLNGAWGFGVALLMPSTSSGWTWRRV